MKKALIMAIVALLATIRGYAQELSVFVYDPGQEITNVRNAPGGKVVVKWKSDHAIMVLVEENDGGWWHIVDNAYWDPEDEESTGILAYTESGYWIHQSVVAVSTRNYGGESINLYENNDTVTPVVYTITEETLLRPLYILDEWVNVQTIDGKHKGWIEKEWLCGNSVTTCP